MNIGERIKELRIKKGLTQLDLANLLYISDRAVSKWEQGKSNPEIDTLPMLSKIFDVSIDYLVTGTNYVQSEKNESNAVRYLESLIGEEIKNESILRTISKQVEGHDLELVKNALDKCYDTYISKMPKPYDLDVFREAIKKIGGIIYNESLPPVDKKIKRIIYCLSKNTKHQPQELTKRCEECLRNYLSICKNTDTVEEKVSVLDKLYQDFMNKHYDLYDAIVYLNHKKDIARRVDSGFFQIADVCNEQMTATIENINICIKTNDLKQLSDALLKYVDLVFRFWAHKLDSNLSDAAIPFITDYYKELYIIYGRFLGKDNFRHIWDIVQKYSEKGFDTLDFEELLSINDLMIKMVNKIEKNYRSASSNFNSYYFYYGKY